MRNKLIQQVLVAITLVVQPGMLIRQEVAATTVNGVEIGGHVPGNLSQRRGNSGELKADLLEKILQKVLDGKALTSNEKAAGQEAFERAEDNSLKALLDLYITSVKLSIIDPTNHDGWPARSWILSLNDLLLSDMLKIMEARFRDGGSSVLHYSRICLALAAGQGELASESFTVLRTKDPFLYALAKKNLGWWTDTVQRTRKGK